MSNTIVNRLAHYVAFSSKYNREDLVINAMNSSSKAISAEELNKFIETDYSCLISNTEIEQILTELLHDEIVTKVSKNRYILSSNAKNSLVRSINEFEDLESKIVSAWEIQLQEKYDLLVEECNLLSNQLKLFCKTLFYNHGVESRQIISNEFSSTTTEKNDIDVVIDGLEIDKLELKMIARTEFRGFLSSQNADIQNYLILLINKAVGYLSQICDPEVIELLKQNLNIKVLFVDTNMIFRLLNLQGESRRAATLEVINLCKEFSIKVKVSHHTLNEFENTINSYSNFLIKYPLPVVMSKIAYNLRNSDNYISAYWNEASINGITVPDFRQRYRNADLLLQEFGIEIVDTTWFDSEVIEIKEEMVSKFSLYVDEHNLDRTNSAINHDGYHLALVYYLQGFNLRRFTDASTFFLTSDQQLVDFQSHLHMLKNHNAPLTLRPSNIINIFQFAKPKDDKYAEVFLEIFSRSSYVPTKITNQSIQMIASKVASVKNSPSVLEKVLSNEYFVRKYSEANSEAEKLGIIEYVIDEEVEKMAFDLSQEKERNVQLQKELEDKSSKGESLEKEVISTYEQISAAKDNINLLQLNLHEKDKKEDQLTFEVVALNKELSSYKTALKTIITVILSLILVAYMFIDYYILINAIDKFIRLVLIIFTGGIYSALFYFYLSKKGAGYFATILAAIIAIYFPLTISGG